MKSEAISFIFVLMFISIFIPYGIVRANPSSPHSSKIGEIPIMTVAEKDTYVNSFSAPSNYGGQNYLYSGFYLGGDVCESYFYFNFSGKPVDYIRAEIFLDIWSVGQTINLTVSLIEESWNEYTMNYASIPTKGVTISNMLLTSDVEYKINITDYVSGRDNISICVYCEVENYVNDYVIINSREDSSYSDVPKLIWTRLGELLITVLKPVKAELIDSGWYEIEWTSNLGIGDYVDIELYKGTEFIETIAEDTSNDGLFEYWLVMTSLLESGTDYRIKIIDSGDSEVYGFSDYFKIVGYDSTLEDTSRDRSDNISGFPTMLFLALISIAVLLRIRKIKK